MNITTIIVLPGTAEYNEVFALRDEILRKPLGMRLQNDDLSRDYTDIILAGTINHKIVCCLMLHHKTGGEYNSARWPYMRNGRAKA